MHKSHQYFKYTISIPVNQRKEKEQVLYFSNKCVRPMDALIYDKHRLVKSNASNALSCVHLTYKYIPQMEEFHKWTKLINCQNLVGCILRVKHTHIQENYSHKMEEYNRILGVSEITGTENGYIYYLDFSSLEYHRVHTETPAL